MDEKTKRMAVNGAACAAKMASVVIPNGMFQTLFQESVDWVRGALLEEAEGMPKVEEFMQQSSTAVQNAVRDILSEKDISAETELPLGSTPQDMADLVLRQSAVARDLSGDEMRPVRDVLIDYLAKMRNWALQDPERLRKYLADFDERLREVNRRVARLDTAVAQVQADFLGQWQNAGMPPEMLLQKMADNTGEYCKKYEETLFLHHGLEKQVTLRDVYVLPGAVAEEDFMWNKVLCKRNGREPSGGWEYDSAAEAIRDFLQYRRRDVDDRPVDFLFLEGQAAMGKSSLTAWMCWNARHADEGGDPGFLPLKEALNGRRLVAVRLRELPESGEAILNLEEPMLQLSAYLLKLEEDDARLKRHWKKIAKVLFQDTLLILEGFDELCMMEGVKGDGKNRYFNILWNELGQLDCNCKIMVTTRPEYLKVEVLNFLSAHLFIKPFEKEQRAAFVEKYERFAPVAPETKEILLQDQAGALEGIVDSPLTLYMIAARNVQLKAQSNLWKIYHDIFANEVFQRSYERGAPHAIQRYQQQLYRLTAEIANALALERHLSISVEKLLDAEQVKALLEQICAEQNKEVQKVLEDCYALASYFHFTKKTDEQGRNLGAIEFYHNNIKDYFYCEYIWLRLEEIYANIPQDELAQERWFLKNFQEMFQYSTELKVERNRPGRAKPLDFLEGRVWYEAANDQESEFIKQEMQQHYFRHFFSMMLLTGGISSYEYTGQENVLNMMGCILSSVLNVYHTIYLPHLDFGERMEIMERIRAAAISTNVVLRLLFLAAGLYDLSHICFDGVSLAKIDFRGRDFYGSSFRDCLLIGCIFSGCDLRGVDFSGASLISADLRGAIIDETTAFSDTTEFENTKIDGAQKQYLLRWVKQDQFFGKIQKVKYVGKDRRKPPSISLA